MAEDIREGVEITFTDAKRKVYPVSLRKLRKLNKVLSKIETTTNDVSDEDIDNMVEAASIVLTDFDIEKDEDREALEDIIDIKTFQQLMAAGMGADPNV